MLPKRSSLIHLLATSWTLLLSAVLLVGCNEEIAAPPGVDEPFSMYGVFTPDLDTQSVLVSPTQDLLRLLPRDPLDAAVTSTDLITGEVNAWNDSLTVDSLGIYEHVFWSDFRAEHGHRYRIEVECTDGARSFAEARVPEEMEVILEPSDDPVQRVRFEGDPQVRVMKPEVVYTVRAYAGLDQDDYTEERSPVLSYVIDYEGRERQVGDRWEFDIRMFFDHEYLKAQYAYDTKIPLYAHIDADIALVAMDLRVLVGDEPWDPPGGIFDPNVIGHPGVLHNVENGFGFVSGGYRIRGVNLFPTQAAIEAAGFYYVPWLNR